jgi:hypothetical protein
MGSLRGGSPPRGRRAPRRRDDRYGTRELLDLVFTVGQYTLVSMALNTLGVALDPGVEGFPS